MVRGIKCHTILSLCPREITGNRILTSVVISRERDKTPKGKINSKDNT